MLRMYLMMCVCYVYVSYDVCYMLCMYLMMCVCYVYVSYGVCYVSRVLQVPFLALTATATPPVRRDICSSLHLRNPLETYTSFDRSVYNIHSTNPQIPSV